ncbi:MAG: response regulator [Endomicrobiaceae bacterium]|nr:response regulator [Endomicrobiaceae bacterium]MDD3922602.1 response regulator [Endomicrobiaceae bacterium]
MNTDIKTKKVIALTDDDSSIRNALERTILKHFDNIEIKQFSTTIELKKFILNNPNILDLLILDIHFGIGETGIDILPYIKNTAPLLQVILLTAMEKTYGQSVTDLTGDLIFDFMSKPVTETELIIKIKKALNNKDILGDKIKDLQSQNTVLASILDEDSIVQQGAGKMFEQEIYNKIIQLQKAVMQENFEPKQNIIINGQEIDIIAFTCSPLPFAILVFETKYFPNAKLSGSVNESMKITVNGKETLSEKRRNLFEQADNQFKQVSKRIEKILRENNFTERNEKFRPFIQTFVVFTDSTDISQLNTLNANRYTKLIKTKDLTDDLIIKTVFSLPKRTVSDKVKKLVLENLMK